MADVTLLQEYGTYEEELMGHSDAVSAHAGGGQGSATALTSKWNTVTTCASDGDSVKLIISKKGYWQSVFNNTSHTLAVFPSSGENINGITNYQISVGAGLSAWFSCTSDGQWMCVVIDPSNQIYSVHISLTSTQLKNLNTSPVDAIPAPGAGYAIEMISGLGVYTKGSINYASGGQIMFITDTAATNSFQLGDSTTPSTVTASYSKKLVSGTGDVIGNKKVVIQASGFNFINGDGTYDIYGIYRVVKL